MINLIKEYRHYCLAALLVIIPLLALNASEKQPANLYWFDKASLRMTAPIQQVLSWMIDAAWGGVEKYMLILHTNRENERLAEANRKLANELAGFREVALENKRLRKLVRFSEAISGRKIIARVVAKDLYQEFRTIRLNKGTQSGIHKGMAAVTYEGIVGRVIRADKDYADVLTLQDSSSNIAGLIQRSRSRGVVEGFTSNKLRMKHLRRTDDVRRGDVVISSGIGSLFPKGLMIGKVVAVKKKNYGITQGVEVYPSVDFSKLEEVMVIRPRANVAPIPEEVPVPSPAPSPSAADKKVTPNDT